MSRPQPRAADPSSGPADPASGMRRKIRLPLLNGDLPRRRGFWLPYAGWIIDLSITCAQKTASRGKLAEAEACPRG